MIDPIQTSLNHDAFSRRQFIGLTTLATGAMAFPSILRAENAGTKLKVGVIGCGGMGTGRLREALGCGCQIVALCDPDSNMMDAAKKEIAKHDAKANLADVKTYDDYRKLLADKNIEAVIVATPDHWHAPIAKAALLAGKHVFCEKPLTHAISEARELRELSKKVKLITQMGNQGSASNNLRRAVELIQAGVIGEVREVHCRAGGVGCHPGLALPTVGDPVPANLNWDEWVGPAPFRPYKQGYYHTWNWRGWLDFGSGPMGDFGCHNLNLPFRALKLDYPTSIDVDAQLMGLPTYPKDARIRYEFAQRGNLPPVTLTWYDGGRPLPEELFPKELVEHLLGKDEPAKPGEKPKRRSMGDGVLILGSKGYTWGGCWNGADYIMVHGEDKISGILNHKASESVPHSLPVSPGHVKEWVLACQGGAPVYSDFDTGGHLTEIALAGVVAARVGKKLEWDGPAMKAKNAPEADQYIVAKYRPGWV